MDESFPVRVSAGSSRSGEGWTLPHAWTDEGVLVEADGTGAHLLHTAVAVCVLNDLFREAGALDLAIEGVAVTARGGFDPSWSSTGIHYEVTVDGAGDRLAELLARVDEVAEIPRAMRAGAVVRRVEA